MDQLEPAKRYTPQVRAKKVSRCNKAIINRSNFKYPKLQSLLNDLEWDPLVAAGSWIHEQNVLGI